jgi:hypothetical protein
MMFVLLVQPMLAQDQTVVVSGNPSVLEPDATANIGNPQDASLCAIGNTDIQDCETRAARLIANIFAIPQPVAGTYYIIHLLRYQDNQVSADKQNWYVYYRDWQDHRSFWDHLKDTRLDHHFEETRIFGGHNIALLYIHLNVPGVQVAAAAAAAHNQAVSTLQQQRSTLNVQSPAVEDRHAVARYKRDKLRDIQGYQQQLGKLPNPDASLQSKFSTEIAACSGDTAQTVSGSCRTAVDSLSVPDIETTIADLREKLFVFDFFQASANEPTVGMLAFQLSNGQKTSPLSANYAVDSRYLPISYKIAATKRVPQPVADLKSIAGIVLGGGSGQASPTIVKMAPTPLVLAFGKPFTITPLPSDMTVTAINGTADDQKTQKEISKQSYLNEQKYRYGFSFAYPVTQLKQLNYDIQGGMVTAKQVTKQNIFAMINLSPIPYDNDKPQFQLLPVFLYGIPISGKPLNRHLLALAFGLNKVQIFAGVTINRTSALQALATGQPATANGLTSNLHDRWVTKLAVGINLPVSTVVKALKGSK